MMRPTAASAQKTHDKPASPPRKSTKAPVSALQKGKKKVEEVAAKAKDAVTSNGHDHDDHDDHDDTATDGTAANEQSNDAHKPEASGTEPAAIQEQATADTSIHESEASAVEVPTAQVTGEAVH